MLLSPLWSHLHLCIKDTQLEPIKGELKERTAFSLVLLEFKTFVRRTNSPVFQVFQKELGKRTGTVQVLKRSGRELIENSRDDTTWVKGQLQELSTRWDTVCKLSVCKQSRLEQALKQVRQHRARPEQSQSSLFVRNGSSQSHRESKIGVLNVLQEHLAHLY